MLFAEELRRIHNSWGWYLVTGIALLFLGFTALIMSGVTTLVTVMTIGAVMLFGGVIEFIHAMATLKNKGAILHGFIGILYAMGGYALVMHPFKGAFTMTLLLGALLIASGVLKLFLSFEYRKFAVSNYMLLNGIVSMILGALIYMQWPVSAMWMIGTFVGATLVLDGCSWIGFAFTAKHLPIVPSEPGPTKVGAY